MEPTSQIREKIDVVDFIGEFVTLKKAGRNFKGLCPFHNENSPSFVVSPERQIWHCFGCQKGGDIFTFLMEYEKMEFPEALRTLAQRAGVELPQYDAQRDTSSKKEKYYQMNRLAVAYYHYLLTKHKVGEKALLYVKGRGLNEKIIETFQLGFAPASGTALVEYMTKRKMFTKEDLLEAGLATAYRGQVNDFFRGRLIFPLFDHRDNPVGFAGRIMEASETKAKYINTRDTLAYHKGEMVFALNVTKEAIRKSNQAILVEGEFDVISSFQHGITNVVAVKGTALTEQQVALLARYAQKITVCFDGDKAGQDALKRSLPLLEKKGVTTTVIVIPGGKDPDEALKTSEAGFKYAVDHDVPVYDYLLNQALSAYDPETLSGKKNISDVLLPLISNISNEIIKEHYLRKLSSTIDTSYESLIRESEKLAKKDLRMEVQAPAKEKKPREEVLEEYLVSLILQSDSPAVSLDQAAKILSGSMPKERAYQKLVIHLLSYFKEHEVFDGQQFGTGLPQELHTSYSISLLFPLPHIEDRDAFEKEVVKTATQLKEIYLKQRMKKLSTLIKKEEEEGNEEEIEKLRGEFSSLVSELKK